MGQRVESKFFLAICLG